MLSFVAPVLYALFLWWFLTGLIMVVYGRSPRTIRLFFAAATLLMLAALAGIFLTRQGTEKWHIYTAVTCSMILWGWHTGSYYLGFVTGPKAKRPFSRHLPLIARFRLALRASLHHELLVVTFVILLAALTWAQANRWGFWLFLAMWLMHLSAKLNIFLGVRNFYIEFLPMHLHPLDRLLIRQPSNFFMPISIILAASIALTLVYHAIIPTTDPAHSAGYLFVGVMIGLGILEHLLLVLPIPATLWGWGVRLLPRHPQTSGTSGRAPNATLRVISKQMIEG